MAQASARGTCERVAITPPADGTFPRVKSAFSADQTQQGKGCAASREGCLLVSCDHPPSRRDLAKSGFDQFIRESGFDPFIRESGFDPFIKDKKHSDE